MSRSFRVISLFTGFILFAFGTAMITGSFLGINGRGSPSPLLVNILTGLVIGVIPAAGGLLLIRKVTRRRSDKQANDETEAMVLSRQKRESVASRIIAFVVGVMAMTMGLITTFGAVLGVVTGTSEYSLETDIVLGVAFGVFPAVAGMLLVRKATSKKHQESATPPTDQPVRFRSGHAIAIVVIILLFLSMLINLITAVLSYSEIELLSDSINGGLIAREETLPLSESLAKFYQLRALAYSGAGILFLVWLYRVSRNLNALQVRGQRYSPRWAVGWWFVPLFNLWRPLQIVQEVWKGSAALQTGPGAGTWRDEPSSPLISLWWTLLVLPLLAGVLSLFILRNGDACGDILAIWWINLATLISSIFAAVLTMLVVLRIDRAQRLRRDCLEGDAEQVAADSG